MIKLGEGFDQFACAAACIEAVKKLAETNPGIGEAYHIISGTHAETFWPAKRIDYCGDVYDLEAWGKNVSSLLSGKRIPGCIIAVRSDIASMIRGNDNNQQSNVHIPPKPVYVRKRRVGSWNLPKLVGVDNGF